LWGMYKKKGLVFLWTEKKETSPRLVLGLGLRLVLGLGFRLGLALGSV